jgi:hypothetical protein
MNEKLHQFTAPYCGKVDCRLNEASSNASASMALCDADIFDKSTPDPLVRQPWQHTHLQKSANQPAIN